MAETFPGSGIRSRKPVFIFSPGPLSLILILFVLMSAVPARPDIIFVDAESGGSDGSSQVHAAASVFGLAVETVRTTDELLARAAAADRDRLLDGMIISASALERIDRQRLLSFYRDRESTVPVLILDITREIGSALLADWSGGAVDGSRDLRSGKGWIRVSELERLASGLSGLEFMIPEPIRYSGLALAGSGRDGIPLGMDLILDIDGDDGKAERMPVVIRRLSDREEVFLAGKIRLEQQEEPDGNTWSFEPRRFVESVPLFLFFRYLRDSVVAVKPAA